MVAVDLASGNHSNDSNSVTATKINTFMTNNSKTSFENHEK